jgi:hypothetical protein
MSKRIVIAGLSLALVATGCQSEGDRILQASACETLSRVGQIARYYADGGLEERDDLPHQVDQLRMQQISPEVEQSRHGDTLREYRDAVLRSLVRQNLVAATGDDGPDWDAVLDQGIESWDEFGCDEQMLTPAVWMPECDELEELRYQLRPTCLSLEERETLREEQEEWLEQQRSSAATDASSSGRPDEGEPDNP